MKGYRDRIPWDVVALADGYALAWVHLAKASDERELTLKLHPAKSIAGQLVDPDGQPIADCKVQVASVEAPGSQWHNDLGDPARLDLWSCELTPRTTTDKEGRFEIVGLPVEKRLTLIAEHPDFARGHFYAATTAGPQAPVEQLSTSADGKREESQHTIHMSGFTESLKRGGRVRGHVLLADTGKPVPGAKVNAVWQNRVHYSIADEEGRFEFTSLVDPKLVVSSSTDAPGYLAARETVSFSEGQWQQEVELRLPRGEKVNGRVIDEEKGAGVAGVRVSYILDPRMASHGRRRNRPRPTKLEGLISWCRRAPVSCERTQLTSATRRMTCPITGGGNRTRGFRRGTRRRSTSSPDRRRKKWC